MMRDSLSVDARGHYQLRLPWRDLTQTLPDSRFLRVRDCVVREVPRSTGDACKRCRFSMSLSNIVLYHLCVTCFKPRVSEEAPSQ